MPYSNFPKNIPTEKIDSCVKKVMGTGKAKENAIAICYDALVKGQSSKEMAETVKEFYPMGVIETIKAMFTDRASVKESTDTATEELTDAELRTIDQLYLDVQAGTVRLGAPDDETDKATDNNPPRGGTPVGTSTGGSSGGYSSKHEKCYLRMKKLGLDDESAHRICKHALAEPVSETKAMQAELTIKQADGHWRWVLVSSSSFQDRDKEIVSQKALEDDTERMNSTKEFGTLDWWHTPIRLGTCDFSAMHDLTRIESGTFDDDSIGESISNKANSLAASLSFRHSVTEPDASGVYNRIRTVSRALLPRGKESNLLTRVLVASKEQQMEMLDTKRKELVTLLGGDKAAEDKVNGLLTAAQESQKAAEQAGLTHKEETSKDDKAWFLSDMKPEEFGALIAKGVQTAMQLALEPVMAEIKSMKEAQTTSTKETGTAITTAIAGIAKTQDALATRIGLLEGLTPKGFRASQDSKTITTEEKAKAAQPGADTPYIAQFIGKITGAPEQPKP